MFVPHSPTQAHYPRSPKPLPALQSNVLAASESSLHLPLPPDAVHTSPLQHQIHTFFSDAPPPLRNDKPAWPGHGGWIGQDVNFGRSNSNARSRQTFQSQKRAKGSSTWQLKQFADATLGGNSLRKCVQLPEGEDRNEWLAVNVVDFYNQINLLYGSITEFCSPTSCPEMKATDEFEYLWHDPPKFPKPTRLPAPTYISHLLTWTSNHLSNATLFPTAPGVPFPADFEKTVRMIFKRLYRIYAHIYCHHYTVVRGLGLEPHLNTGFKHYVLFVEEFGLAEEGGSGGKGKGEWWGPLGELVESMLRSE
ncbi:Mitotic exit network component [Oleoguttula sp. CCFEE 5521]